jgi:hypothetical protein
MAFSDSSEDSSTCLRFVIGTCWQPISTSVIDELHDSSIAVITAQRIRDIRVFAAEFIKASPRQLPWQA